MEGFAILAMMKELAEAGFTVSKILHDKDSTTMKNVMDVFADVEEALCLSKYFFLYIVNSFWSVADR